MLHTMYVTFFYKKLIQYNWYLVCTVYIDDLGFEPQGISSNSVDYALMRFQLFMG